MEILLLIVRLVLFGIFAIAGMGKLLDLDGSRRAVKAFGTPEPFVGTFAVLIPIAELTFAACLLFVGFSWVGAIGALLLLVTFIGGMLVQIIQGNAPDCHCFGQIHSEPVGPKSLVRNIVIAILPVILILSGRDRQGYPLGGSDAQIATNAAIAAVVIAFIIALTLLIRLRSEQAELIRRVELLEMLDGVGRPVERAAAADPNDSLPIGALMPPFVVRDVAGREVASEMLIRKTPTLLMFVGPNCAPCKAMLPDIQGWLEEFNGRLRVVFISRGSVDENRERFGDEILARMLFQDDMEVARSLYASWTPAALLIGADGRIASRPAISDTAIRDLIGLLRREDFIHPGFFVANGNKPGRVKVGERISPFKLPTADGKELSNEFFSGSESVAFFLSTTCAHCAEMIDQIRKWEVSPERNGTKAVVFSEGDPELHLSYGLSTPIALDRAYRVATGMGMFGAPSAVLIDADGKIASETAVGGPMIWALVGHQPE